MLRDTRTHLPSKSMICPYTQKQMSARFTRRSFAASVGLGAAGLCVGQGSSDGDLDAFIRARMESAHVPGLSLAIIRDGKLLRAAGFGFANLAQQRPMRADTLINVGFGDQDGYVYRSDAAVGAEEVLAG